MSIQRTIELQCDVEVACVHGRFEGTDPTTTGEQLRTYARRYGWRHRGGKDVCNACATYQDRLKGKALGAGAQ